MAQGTSPNGDYVQGCQVAEVVADPQNLGDWIIESFNDPNLAIPNNGAKRNK